MAASGEDDKFFYRVEVTENGPADLFNFFYKEDSSDAWTQFGPGDLAQDFDHTAVGIYTKGHDTNTTASTSFDYLTVGTLDQIPEPNTGLLAGLAAFSLAFRRGRK